ncbi:hypothetical protein TorRG33x02_087860 [Trema orientale]|uniref:Uncharacterized protein n=1 Tax=Trema orientale TaxID=63057 RepID=A0A2P5FBW0_TREOI|nr:hypothetical protein TorRG33x02_087860 [Trema orientale]
MEDRPKILDDTLSLTEIEGKGDICLLRKGIIKHTSRLPSFEFGDVAFQLTFKNLMMTSSCSDLGVLGIVIEC